MPGVEVSIKQANLGGLIAILLWSSSSLLISFTADVPALLFVSLTQFCCFAILSLRWIVKAINPIPYFYGNVRILLFTMFGLGSNTLCLVYALRLAPVEEANLINYLWPMLSLLAASFLPDQRFRLEYIIGGLIGFIGVAFLILKDPVNGFTLSSGHIIAFIGALIWALYSTGTRLIKDKSSDYVAVAFLMNACFLFAAHMFLEESWSADLQSLGFIGLLGATSGISYSLWDFAMKHGHIQMLAVLSNAMPLLSTLYLILFGMAAFTVHVIVAAVLIVLGTLIASRQNIVSLLKLCNTCS